MFAIVLFVSVVSNTPSRSNFQSLFDARDEIAQLSNMIKKREGGEEAFTSKETHRNEDPQSRQHALVDDEDNGDEKKKEQSKGKGSDASDGGSGSSGESPGKKKAIQLVAKMKKDGLKVPADLLKMAGEDQAPAPQPVLAATPKAAAAGNGGTEAAAPGSGLSLEVRKTVARLKVALHSLEKVEEIMG